MIARLFCPDVLFFIPPNVNESTISTNVQKQKREISIILQCWKFTDFNLVRRESGGENSNEAAMSNWK